MGRNQTVEDYLDNPLGASTVDEYPGQVVGETYPAPTQRPQPTGPTENYLSEVIAGVWQLPFPSGAGTHDTMRLPGIPRGYMFKNHSSAPLYIGLGSLPEGALIGGQFDDECDPSQMIWAPWPEGDALRRQLTWYMPGAANVAPGFVRWWILPYDPGGGVDSLGEGPATSNQSWNAQTIVADGAHAHDVTLTLSPVSKSVLLANDSASGQGGMNVWFTNRVNQQGVPIFPNPLPTTGDNGPFAVAQGKEYVVDIIAQGILVSNPDNTNALTYRIDVTS